MKKYILLCISIFLVSIPAFSNITDKGEYYTAEELYGLYLDLSKSVDSTKQRIADLKEDLGNVEKNMYTIKEDVKENNSTIFERNDAQNNNAIAIVTGIIVLLTGGGFFGVKLYVKNSFEHMKHTIDSCSKELENQNNTYKEEMSKTYDAQRKDIEKMIKNKSDTLDDKLNSYDT
jgi:hypothetical protein